MAYESLPMPFKDLQVFNEISDLNNQSQDQIIQKQRVPSFADKDMIVSPSSKDLYDRLSENDYELKPLNRPIKQVKGEYVKDSRKYYRVVEIGGKLNYEAH